jgi:hypothetical protein
MNSLARSLLCKIGNTKFCSFLSQFIFLSQEPAAPTAGVEDREEEAEDTTPTQAPGSPDLAVEVREELMVKQMSFNAFTYYDFIKSYHRVSSKTGWFQDGHRRAISDFHVTSQHKDNFHVTLQPSRTLFVLQTRVSPTLLKPPTGLS